MQPAIGLSVGVTNLAAVTADSSLTRRPVLTLYPHRPSEVGGRGENPNLTEPGLVIADFVNRVGGPAGIAATDRSTHRAEDLLADALRALAHAATAGGPLPDVVGVTYPAYWSSAAVAALRDALSRVAVFSQGLLMLSEVEAALAALPIGSDTATGVIPVCDFGGSGATITLVRVGEDGDCSQVDAGVRYPGLSGELIDQGLVNQVVADVTVGGSFEGTVSSGIGSLAGLRALCRDAKERLSTAATTTLRVDLPGFAGDVELTRADVDEVLAEPLAAFCSTVRNILEDNGFSDASVVAVAAVGGGANIPGLVAGLSDRFGVPVITAPQPQLVSALGAALLAGQGRATASFRAADSPAAAPAVNWVRRLALLAGVAAGIGVAAAVAMLLLRSGPSAPAPAPPAPSRTVEHRTTSPRPAIPVVPPPAPSVTEPPTYAPQEPETVPEPTIPEPTASTPVTPTTTVTPPVTPTTPTTSTTSPAEVPHIPNLPGIPRPQPPAQPPTQPPP